MTKIVIIGAGIVGATIAYELSAIKGLEITLIDEKKPGQGATGAALGILMGIISHKTKGRAWKLRQESLKRYETLLPELESLTGLTIPCNRDGIVLLRSSAEDEENWRKLAQIRQEQGYCLEIWDKETLKQKCPQVASDHLQGAIYSPSDHQINPALLTEALVTAAARRGVKCQFGVKVENFGKTELHGSNLRQCTHVYSSNGIEESDFLILSAGIGSTALTETLTHPVEIRPVLGQALQIKLTQPLESSDFKPILTGNDLHILPLAGAEYWIGATVEFMDEKGEIIADTALLEQVYQKAIAFCPSLAAGAIVRTWSGKRPRPEKKSAPIIEYLPGYDNVILATGHYRNGVLLAPATAKMVREMLSGKLAIDR
ncbi:NAD(P)/FAD-dependent oxidoreductase [Microcystis aeruginosa]|uniref:NAD(P)/FAD-dependent oxidoreductase n=1 Tax=Microcystis aeruginosa TaxID=1126 RepID=UPI00232BB63F|nr:FAD-dependent oxidoreductase [Microcystis aeruginosa]MDB9417639.1 FAD-dependent oxidoreductase [Microcystis aeruginosa CS-556/03]